MNGYSASGFSSGCESGWTMYLDHSSASPNYSCQQKPDQVYDKGVAIREENCFDEEDLSMVSDASSGPQPHFHEQAEDYCNNKSGFYNCHASSSVPTLMKKNIKRQKTDDQQQQQQQQQQKQSSLLDDTAASSHVLSFPKEKYQKRAALQNTYGFFKSSVPRNPTPAEPVFRRRKDRTNIW